MRPASRTGKLGASAPMTLPTTSSATVPTNSGRGGHAAVGERRHGHHDGRAQHVGRGQPLHGGHVHAQVGHDGRERHVEERLVERGEERGECRHRHDGRGFAKCCGQSEYLLLPPAPGAGVPVQKKTHAARRLRHRSCTVIRFTCRKAPHVSFAIPIRLFEALRIIAGGFAKNQAGIFREFSPCALGARIRRGFRRTWASAANRCPGFCRQQGSRSRSPRSGSTSAKRLGRCCTRWRACSRRGRACLRRDR